MSRRDCQRRGYSQLERKTQIAKFRCGTQISVSTLLLPNLRAMLRRRRSCEDVIFGEYTLGVGSPAQTCGQFSGRAAKGKSCGNTLGRVAQTINSETILGAA